MTEQLADVNYINPPTTCFMSSELKRRELPDINSINKVKLLPATSDTVSGE